MTHEEIMNKIYTETFNVPFDTRMEQIEKYIELYMKYVKDLSEYDKG